MVNGLSPHLAAKAQTSSDKDTFFDRDRSVLSLNGWETHRKTDYWTSLTPG